MFLMESVSIDFSVPIDFSTHRDYCPPDAAKQLLAVMSAYRLCAGNFWRRTVFILAWLAIQEHEHQQHDGANERNQYDE